MWTLGPRPPVRCNAPDSLAGQALRSGGALLTGAGLEWSACGIVTSEQTALIADAQSTVGELMDEYRTAHEMYSLASGGQLQHQVFEGDGVVVAHDPFMSARQQQLQFETPASLTKALSGWAGLVVKRRLKSGMNRCSR